MQRRRGNEQQRRQPRCRQVDQIVEPRRGPAEGLIARRAMADHAVGGVDCLVECRSRETGDGHPQHRRDDSVGKILGEAFDRRAGDAGGIQRAGIAADDLRDCGAAADDAALFQRVGDIGDVPVQAALRDQGAGDDGDGDQSERQAQQLALDNEGDCADDAEEQQDRDDASAASPVRVGHVAIEQAVERGDQAADPGHRMADRAQQRAADNRRTSSISMAKSASATDIFPYNDADEPLPHGGDLAAARRLFPDAPEPFIDLSTGINPNPYPLPAPAGRTVRPLAGCRGNCPSRCGRRAHLWRAVGGACRAGAGHADSVASCRRPGAAGPRGNPIADL